MTGETLTQEQLAEINARRQAMGKPVLTMTQALWILRRRPTTMSSQVRRQGQVTSNHEMDLINYIVLENVLDSGTSSLSITDDPATTSTVSYSADSTPSIDCSDSGSTSSSDMGSSDSGSSSGGDF